MNEENKEKMSKVSYSFVVDSLMYVMVCISPNISYIVVVTKFLMNLRSSIEKL